MSPSIRHLVGLLCGWAGVLSLPAEPGSTAESPFLPAGAVPGATPDNAILELHGIIVVNNEPVFGLVDTAAPVKKGVWVKLNETGRDFVVKSYEAQSETVSVDYRGRLLQLALVKPKVTSSGMAAPPLPGQPNAAQTAGGPVAPVVLNPTPADEAARLEAFAAEVRRRRQLREQGMPPTPSAQPMPQPAMAPANNPRPGPRQP